jgi:hypothetical protein
MLGSLNRILRLRRLRFLRCARRLIPCRKRAATGVVDVLHGAREMLARIDRLDGRLRGDASESASISGGGSNFTQEVDGESTVAICTAGAMGWKRSFSALARASGFWQPSTLRTPSIAKRSQETFVTSSPGARPQQYMMAIRSVPDRRPRPSSSNF